VTKPARLSAAQLAFLEWVARLGAVTDEALVVWRGTRLGTANSQLAAAEHAGLIARQRVLVRNPALYIPTRAGLRAVGQPDLRPCRVTAANARHLIACAGVAAMLERRYPDQRVQGERQLRRDERNAGRPLASARLRGIGGGASEGEGASMHRPDLVLWPPLAAGCGPVVVEVELAIKSPRRLRAICEAWAECRCVAGVVYLVTPDVEPALTRAIAAAAAQRRIAVMVLDTLPGFALQRTVPSTS
jgi:hypothetical protein